MKQAAPSFYPWIFSSGRSWFQENRLWLLSSMALHALLLLGLDSGHLPAAATRHPIEMTLQYQKPALAVTSEVEKKEEDRLPPPAVVPPKNKSLAELLAQKKNPAVKKPKKQPPPSNTSHPTPETEALPALGLTAQSVTTVAAVSVALPLGNTLSSDLATSSVNQQPKSYAYVPEGELDSMPQPLGECKAYYPLSAKEQGIDGRVLLEVEILKDGRVGDVVLKKGLGYGLDEAAMEALKRCRFQPAMTQGHAVVTHINYTYVFILDTSG